VNTHAKVGKGINTGLRMSMMCARGRVTRHVRKHLSHFEFEMRIRISSFELEFSTWIFNLLTNIDCVLLFLVLSRKLLIQHHNVLAKPKGLQMLQNGANLDSMFTFRMIKVDGSSRSRAVVALHTLATVI
jgi:hypothetical protein